MSRAGTECESYIFNMAARGETISLSECEQSHVDKSWYSKTFWKE